MFHNDAITNLILEIQRPVCSLTSIHFARSVFKMFLVIQSVSEMILASLKREFPSHQRKHSNLVVHYFIFAGIFQRTSSSRLKMMFSNLNPSLTAKIAAEVFIKSVFFISIRFPDSEWKWL